MEDNEKFGLKNGYRGNNNIKIGGMNMKLPSHSYNSAKKIIVDNVGKDVDFISKVSRGKIIKNEGTILNAYNNIFTISTNIDNKDDILSFSYSDLINHSLRLKIK